MSDQNHLDHFEGMKGALTEVHADVRGYDTKAQIMGIGFIFSLGVIFNILEGFSTDRDLGWFQLLAAFVLSIAPVVLYGAVLYPYVKRQRFIRALVASSISFSILMGASLIQLT
ncbi:MAG: hypothetical protein OQK24_02740 [Magnetovibrio sp.]|nr:hypothetical protein [Magnetovibrio sp.]